MATFFLDHSLDIVVFAVVVLVGSGTVHLYVRRTSGRSGLNWRAWVILTLLVVIGAAFAVQAGETERDRLKKQVEGFAPTYAIEIEKAGHARVGLDTPPDDPNYLKMIDFEKQWLSINNAINDIYTFRAKPDGQVVLVVDSETDYDHNGRFEGEREQRTAIGEPVVGDTTAWKKALAGERAFDGVPYTDRWGTWVSAYVPLRDAAGNIEGGLGVDFEAGKWTQAILNRRIAILSFVSVAILILVWSGKVISLANVEIHRRKAVEDSLRESEGRLRAILDNEPESVLVTAVDGTLLEINPSGLAMLEVNGETAGLKLLQFLASEQAEAAKSWLQSVSDGRSRPMTLQVQGRRGSERWIDAHAVPLPKKEGVAAQVLIVGRDVTLQRAAEAEREKLQSQLMDASRQAGMAEIANGVIHNVGNVLNTVNVGANVVTERLRNSRAPNLLKAVAMLRDHRDDLSQFLESDERGRQLPEYLDKLAVNINAENERMLGELRNVADGIEHIKAIVNAQQSHAGRKGVEEMLRPAAVFEDAVKMNIASCERHAVNVERQFDEQGPILMDKHKVLQILVNLLSNAKNALKEGNSANKQILLRLCRGGTTDEPTVRFEVKDSGMGIPSENLQKIFTMGFTTRKSGHGFGLHTAINLAREMGGTMSVTSPGLNQGATFVLELPARCQQARRAA